MSKGSWFVYIVESERGLYTGITTDLERRMEQHRQGVKKGGAKFFALSGPSPTLKVVFVEKCSTRSMAQKRESAIKKMGRKEKLALIEESS